ncbi:hypothetical protein BDQ17DRAFT_1176074, partial [Cyathus striatus]
ATISSDCLPCSNHLVMCTICPEDSLAIWKYNLQSHILAKYPGATVDIYKLFFEITKKENVLMKAAYLAKPRTSKKKCAGMSMLKISEGH